MSGVILLIGALALGGRGLNLGIDFTSGTQISVGLQRPATVAQMKSVMQDIGEGNATIQKISGDKALGPYGFQIASKYLGTFKSGSHKGQSQETVLTNDLQQRFGIRSNASGNQDLGINTVGPTFGSTVANSAVIAIIASLVVISLYVALRFEWKFTVPVLIALMHDLLITSGVYALTGRVVTTDTVAALLTILGYSLYDTIIVFDRVRENIPRMPRAAFSQIVNRSMSEVLTRSLATTSCTLLPIIALLLFGGSTLKDFAFALLIGVASGAYSSIFIASPVLTHWKERETQFRHRRERILTEYGTVPAYAESGADVEPSRGRNRPSGRLTAPMAETVSTAEFEEMKRELGIEEEAAGRGASSPAPGRATRSSSGTAAPPRPAAPGRSAASGHPAAGGRPAPPGRPAGPSRPGGRGASTPPSPEARPAQPPSAPATPPAGDGGGNGEGDGFTRAPDVAENEGMVQGPKAKRPAKGRNRRHGRRR
jgi:SecD/SecF fusion protein